MHLGVPVSQSCRRKFIRCQKLFYCLYITGIIWLFYQQIIIFKGRFCPTV